MHRFVIILICFVFSLATSSLSYAQKGPNKRKLENAEIVEGAKKTRKCEKPHKCKYCQRGFKRKDDCRRHEKLHSGVKAFACRFCPKRFTLKSNCKTHEKIHLGIKDFSCRYCNKKFVLKGNCISHERTHTKEKPFKCRHCDRRFSHRETRSHHERTHESKGLYRCRYCEQEFVSSFKCGRHERSHNSHCLSQRGNENTINDELNGLEQVADVVDFLQGHPVSVFSDGSGAGDPPSTSSSVDELENPETALDQLWQMEWDEIDSEERVEIDKIFISIAIWGSIASTKK